MRLVCLSDTHLQTAGLAVPEGDLLVHAGDLTFRGTEAELRQAAGWLLSLPHPYKVVVAGNHDFGLEAGRERGRELFAGPGMTYLCDEEVVVGGLRIWGSPWQPWFHDWAFNLPRGAAIREKWDLIPAGVDVLVTHGPPQGVLDRTVRGEDVGCEELLQAVARVRPRVHVFGHIHEGSGEIVRDGTRFVNAAVCDVRYRPVYPPRVVEVEPRGGGVPPAAAGAVR